MTFALDGLRVLDLGTVIAAPTAARYLADFGADVIKVESPEGDPTRRLGWQPPEGGDAYFWKLLGRGKRCIALNLKDEHDKQILWRLIDTADIVIENYRPGTLERLGFAPEKMLERRPHMVILRLTGFGQDGPYANKPGFATVIEGLSGYGSLNGEPDGGPLLPPIAITDELAGIVGAFAIMVALRHAERTGEGQVVDVNLLESMLQVMGPLPAAYKHLGYIQPRLGSGLHWTAPRGAYECADGRWVAFSASADTVARRLLKLLDLEGDPRFVTFADRTKNRVALEEYVKQWVKERHSDDVLAQFEAVDAAIAPVYDMAEVVNDPHNIARDTFVEVDGTLMQQVVARFEKTPGRIKHAGHAHDADRADILDELDRLDQKDHP